MSQRRTSLPDLARGATGHRERVAGIVHERPLAGEALLARCAKGAPSERRRGKPAHPAPEELAPRLAPIFRVASPAAFSRFAIVARTNGATRLTLSNPAHPLPDRRMKAFAERGNRPIPGSPLSSNKREATPLHDRSRRIPQPGPG